jgi:oxaloacetate decarboxylase alpha subunit
VFSNLKHQLRELHIEDRLDEVIEECVRICAETGEPHMITPYSQYVVTQAAINVALGERYKIVIDNFITYAMGLTGDESGYLDMDPNLRDRFVNLPRAAALREIAKNSAIERDMPLKDLRRQYGAHLSDEDFLLQYIMGSTGEIEAMRQATKDYPFHTYSCIGAPILKLIDELSKLPKTAQFQVQFQGKSLTLK